MKIKKTTQPQKTHKRAPSNKQRGQLKKIKSKTLRYKEIFPSMKKLLIARCWLDKPEVVFLTYIKVVGAISI